jgi:hypothetical protein
MLSEGNAGATNAPSAEDFTKTPLYEVLTAELLTYKRQRDQAREKSSQYKSQWKSVCQELSTQTTKFELLAQEFRNLLQNNTT